MRENYRRIGDYIELVDERNKDLSVDLLLGLSITKEFIPSVANTVGSNMANYKIIRKGQFACSMMQVRRDKKMPVALLRDYEASIISQAYPVFKVVDETALLPEYLMMWFSRAEFDREACFYAVGGVRGSLEWEDFCNMELPVPSIAKQREVVAEYNSVVNRIKLNEQINQKLEETAQAIYRRWFVEFEFPISKDQAIEMGKPELEGKPYKSSGGKMVWNEELEKEVPEGWEKETVKEFSSEMKSGGTPSRSINEYWSSNDIPWLKTGEIKNNVILKSEEWISELGLKNSSAKLLPKDTVLMSMYGANSGEVGYLKFLATTNQACCGIVCESKYDAAFLFYNLLINQDYHHSQATGGAQQNLSKEYIANISILIPREDLVRKSNLFQVIDYCTALKAEFQKLSKLKDTLLSKMTKVESKNKMEVV